MKFKVLWIAGLMLATTAGQVQAGFTITDLGTLGGTVSAGFGINDGGEVTGYSTTAGGEAHAFLRDGFGTMNDLGTLGGTYQVTPSFAA